MEKNRIKKIERKTSETDIVLLLSLDATDICRIDTGCGFLDHMLTLFARHGHFGLDLKCVGDINVDYHHTVEDIGIALGEAFSCCLGDMRGITRYGSVILPMDETLILCAADISGRAHLSYEVDFKSDKIGDFDTELVKEFFLGFIRKSSVTLHIRQLAGENSHHIAEGIFKAFARTMAAAVKIEAGYEDEIPSTKGVL